MYELTLFTTAVVYLVPALFFFGAGLHTMWGTDRVLTQFKWVERVFDVLFALVIGFTWFIWVLPALGWYFSEVMGKRSKADGS